MKLKFTISTRLIISFGVLSLAVVLGNTLTYFTLNRNLKISEEISEVYNPSVDYLNQLKSQIINSQILIQNWVFIELKSETPDKKRLVQLHSDDFPDLDKKIAKIVPQWSTEDSASYVKIHSMIKDSLFAGHKWIMAKLTSFEAYQVEANIFLVREKLGDVIRITDFVLFQLQWLLKKQNDKAEVRNGEMKESFDRFQSFIIMVGAASLLLAFITALFTIQSLLTPIRSLKEILVEMGKGILPRKKLKVTHDEMGEMTQALNNLTEGLRKTSEFSQEIGEGNFNTHFEPLSVQDSLGNALLNMRENLRKATQEQEKRKNEDEERNWLTRGLALFSDILRTSGTDMNNLSYEIIRNLVKYLEANQASMFILNDNDKNDIYLEQTALFAYDRRKFSDTRIKPGVGMVGTVFMEKQTAYMSKVPHGYVHITSGLGQATPSFLLVVPMEMNEVVYGVIEIASFKEFSPIQVTFVERVGENIASAIANVKVSMRTAQLLKDSQQKGEQLASQEEVMRNNIEEIRLAQQEAESKAMMSNQLIEALEKATMKLEVDQNGLITKVNQNFLLTLQLRIDEVLQKRISTFVPIEERDNFDQLWDQIINEGRVGELIIDYQTHTNRELKLYFSLSPIKQKDKAVKILCVVHDLSLAKRQQVAYI